MSGPNAECNARPKRRWAARRSMPAAMISFRCASVSSRSIQRVAWMTERPTFEPRA